MQIAHTHTHMPPVHTFGKVDLGFLVINRKAILAVVITGISLVFWKVQENP